MTVELNALLCCPFCGSDNIKIEEYLPECCVTMSWKVGCEDCWVFFEDQHNAKEATAVWNARAT